MIFDKAKYYVTSRVKPALGLVLGFTLIELVITVAVVGVVASGLVGSYDAFVRNSNLDNSSRVMVSDIKTAQASATSGVDANRDGAADQWGVCFRNPDGDNNDLYEIVSPPVEATCAIGQVSANIIRPIYLPSGVNFLDDPANGTAKIVIFNKISGSTTAASEVNVVLTAGARQKVVTIDISGQVGVGDVAVNSITAATAPNTGSFAITNVRGAGFKSGAVVKLSRPGQSDIACSSVSFSSSALLTGGSCALNVAPTYPALAGLWSVTVLNSDGKFGSLTNGFTVTALAPVVSSINPSTITNGGPAAITSVGGSNFQTGAVVTLSKANQPSIGCSGFTFTNPSTLSNGVCNMSGAVSGTWDVAVTNAGGDSQSSSAVSLLTINNDVPVVTAISPNTATQGDPEFLLTVTGTKFLSNSVIRWCDTDGNNCSDKTTTFANQTTLTTTIVTADIGDANHQVKVFNPEPGGGLSLCDGTSACEVTVTASQLNQFLITGISVGGVCTTNASALQGATVAIKICGSGFNLTNTTFKLIKSGLGITCGSITRTSETEINGSSCSIPLTASTGTWDVVVTKYGPEETALGSAMSPAVSFTVNNATMLVSKIAPNYVYLDSGVLSAQPILAIYGSDFRAPASGSIFDGTVELRLNGGSAKTCTNFTYVNPTLLANGRCNLTGATAGNWTAVVTNSVANGRGSAGSDCGVAGQGTGCVIIAAQNSFTTCITNPSASFYWVGSSGNWSTTAVAPKWALSATGSASALALAPCAGSTVYFAAGPGTGTVTINADSAIANLSFEGMNQAITLAGASALTISGSMSLKTNTAQTVTSTYTGAMSLTSNNVGNILSIGGTSLANAVEFNGSGGGWTLIDSLTLAAGKNVVMTVGTFDTNGNTVSIGKMIVNGGTLTLGLSDVTTKDSGAVWAVSSGNVNAASSTISTSIGSNVTFSGGGKVYNNLIFSSSGTAGITGTGNVFNNITFNNAGASTISGGLTAHDVVFNNTNTNVTINNTNTFNGIFDANNGTGIVTFTADANKFYGAVTFDNTGGAGNDVVVTNGNSFYSATTSSGDVLVGNTNAFTGGVTAAGVITIGNANSFAGALTVSGSGASSIGNTNTVTGNASFAGTTTIAGDSASASCSPSTTKNTFSGTLTTTGAGDDLVINGSCNIFTGAVAVGGVLTMNANMNGSSFGSTLTVAGTTTSNIRANGSFTGLATFAGPVQINGSSNAFTGGLTTTGSGSLTINSALTGNTFGAVSVAGTATLNSDNVFNSSLAVVSTTTLVARNRVVGVATFGGTTISGSDNDFDSSLGVTGSLTINSSLVNNFDGAVTVSGAASINAGNTFNGTVSVAGALTMTSGNHFDGSANTLTCGGVANSANVCVSGTGTSSLTNSNNFNGIVKFTGTGGSTLLTIGSTNTFENNLIVAGSGTSTIAGSVGNVNTFKGTMDFGGSLTITGGSNVFGNDSADALTLTGTGDLIFNAGATSNTFAGNVRINNGIISMNAAANKNTFSGTLTTTAGSGTSIISSGAGSSTKNIFTGAVDLFGAATIGSYNDFSATPTALTVRGTGSTSVVGNNRFYGAVAISGSTSITGSTNAFDGALSVAGASSNLTISSGQTNNVFTGAVTVGGIATLNSSNTFSSSLTVSGAGASSIGNSNSFTGAVSFSDSTASSTLSVGTGNTFSGALTASGTGTAPNTIASNTFNGATSFAHATAMIGANSWGASSSLSLIGAGTARITATQTTAFKSFTRAPQAASKTDGLQIDANQTISSGGSFTLTGKDAASRFLVTSQTFGTPVTITTSGATVSLQDVDFRDITGTATWTGTRLGDAKGNSNISFTAGANKYWIAGAGGGNWSDGSKWSLTSGGSTCSCNPLPQDTAMFNLATGTVTIDSGAQRTSGMNFTGASSTPAIAFSNSTTVFGGIVLTSTVGVSGTSSLTFGARNASVSVTSAGRTFTPPILINASGGTVTLADAFVSNSASGVTLTNGTLAVSNASVSLVSLTATAGTLNTGSGTWTVSGTGTPWNISSGVTVNASTGTISLTGTSAKNFTGGGKTYYDLSISNAGATSIDANNNFNNLTDSSVALLTIAGPTTNGRGTFNTFNYSNASGAGVTLNDGGLPTNFQFASTFSATGAVTINGANVFTGNATLGSGSNAVAINNAGNRFYGTATFNNTGNVTIAGGNNAFDDTVNMASNGVVTISGSSNTFATSGSPTGKSFAITGTASATISGSRFYGTGTVTCSGAPANLASNCFGGNVTLASDNNIFDSSLATTGTGTLTINPSLTGNTFSDNVTVAGAATVNSGSTFTKAVSIGGNFSLGSSNTFGVVSSTVSTVNVTGNLTMGSSNLFRGTTNTLCTSTANVCVAGTGTSSMTDSNTFAANVKFSGAGGSALLTIGSTNTFSGLLTVTGTGASSLVGSNGVTGAVSFGGNTTISGNNNTFSNTFTTTGTGSLTFSSASSNANNIFTGQVTLGGLLNMGSSTQGGNHFNSTSNMTVGSGSSSISANNNFNGDVAFGGSTTINGTLNTFGTVGTPKNMAVSSGNLVFASTATSNTFWGSVNISNGVLTMNSGANSNLFKTTVTASTSVSGSTISSSNTFTGAVSTAGAATVSNSNSFIDTVSIGGNLSLGSSNTFGVVSSTVSTVNVTGNLTMGSSNLFRGTTNTLCTSTANVCVAGTGTSSMTDSNTFAANVKFSGAGGSALLTIGSTNTFSGLLTVTGTGASSLVGSNGFSNIVSFGGNVTISGGSNTFSSTLTTTGTGNLTFSGATSGANPNTFVGTVTVAGGLIMNSGANNNQFQNTGTAIVVNGSGVASSISASNVFGSGSAGAVTFTSMGSGNLTIGASNVFRGPFSYTSSTGNLTASGGETFSNNLSFTSSSTGSLTISAGATTMTGTATLTFNGGGSFTLSSISGGGNLIVQGSNLAASALSGSTIGNFSFIGSNSGTITSSLSNTFTNFTMGAADGSVPGQKTYRFQKQSVQTITGNFVASGAIGCIGATTCSVLTMTTVGVETFTLNVGGTANVSRLKVSNSTAGGAAPAGGWYCSTVSESCSDGLNNSGNWSFTP